MEVGTPTAFEIKKSLTQNTVLQSEASGDQIGGCTVLGGLHWQNSTNPGKLLRKRFSGLLGPKTQPELQQMERPETPANKGIPGHAPDRTRTCGLLLRRQTLYPPELRRRNTIFDKHPTAALELNSRVYNPLYDCHLYSFI